MSGAADVTAVAITLPQGVWQRVEDLIGAALTSDPDDEALISAFWELRGEDDGEQAHIAYPDGTCSDGCVALHPDHADTRDYDPCCGGCVSGVDPYHNHGGQR